MFLEMNFKSSELKRQTQVYILIPDMKKEDDLPLKTMWLLHGRSDNHTSWMRNTSIERYAQKHRLAVIMPNADRNWYTDTVCGTNYFSFITKELPELCFRTFSQMSPKREDNIVAGLSMGGYGAMKAAFTCPEQYGSCISLSGGLDITADLPKLGFSFDINEFRGIFGFNLNSPVELKGSKHDLYALTAKAKGEGKQLPKLYMWCGTEDGLFPVNRSFDQHLIELGISHKFESSEGNHSWKWWDLHIQNALEWVLKN